MLGEPEGPPEIFPRVQPCSPIVECGSAFCEEISKGMEILVNYPILLTYYYGGNIDVSFVLSSKGTIVCNSSSSVLFLNRISPSLLYTFVAYTLSFPLPLNIPVILSYTNTSRVSAFGRLHVEIAFVSTHICLALRR